MKRIKLDPIAVETFPFRILIIVIVLAIIIPIIIYGMHYYLNVHRENMLRTEVNRISAAVVQVYNMGLNGSLVLSVSLPEGTEYISIGDALSSIPSQYEIRYKLEGGEEQKMIVRDDGHTIPMTSNKNRALILSGTGGSIVLQKRLSTINIDFDENPNDFYVELALLKT